MTIHKCNGKTNQCRKCAENVQRDRMIYQRPDYSLAERRIQNNGGKRCLNLRKVSG